MEQAKHLMVDIETLGLGIDRNFVITAIGIVPFEFDAALDVDWEDPGSVQHQVERCLSHPKNLHLRLDWTEQQERGAVIEAGTVTWWLQQNPQALRDMFPRQQSCFTLIQQLIPVFGAADYLWGNGNTFDNMALRQLFKRFEQTLPVHFARDLDLRTLKYMAELKAGQRLAPMRGVDVIEHNALHDAALQAVAAQYYWSVLHGA